MTLMWTSSDRKRVKRPGRSVVCLRP